MAAPIEHDPTARNVGSTPGCLCPDCDEIRRVRKVRRVARDQGRPRLVLRHEYEEAVARLTDFRNRGMTRYEMQISSGGRLHFGSFADWINGTNKTMNRRSYDIVMGMQFARGAGAKGARVSPLGSMRRIQALKAAGWPAKTALAHMIGMNEGAIADISYGNRAFVFYGTHEHIKEVYAKYAHTDPLDHGVRPGDHTRALGWARKAGYAPPHCWDDDTLDDPDAWPEWTGACGTVRGYRLHIRHGIPICAECRMAQSLHRLWPRLAELMGAGYRGNEDDDD